MHATSASVLDPCHPQSIDLRRASRVSSRASLRDSPHAGREITTALDDGYAVVLVSADGRERLITVKTLAAAS
jgi:hypothetical protein